MTIHVEDFYMDGHKAVPFCKVCSAEGSALLEDCPQKVTPPKKYADPEKPLDEKKQAAK